MTDTLDTKSQAKVRNPCMGVCSLDERDVCIACRRSGIEIAQWGVFSEQQKREALEKIEQRFLQE